MIRACSLRLFHMFINFIAGLFFYPGTILACIGLYLRGSSPGSLLDGLIINAIRDDRYFEHIKELLLKESDLSEDLTLAERRNFELSKKHESLKRQKENNSEIP